MLTEWQIMYTLIRLLLSYLVLLCLPRPFCPKTGSLLTVINNPDDFLSSVLCIPMVADDWLILFCSDLICSILFFVRCCSVLFSSILFHYILFCFLLISVLFLSVLLKFIKLKQQYKVRQHSKNKQDQNPLPKIEPAHMRWVLIT